MIFNIKNMIVAAVMAVLFLPNTAIADTVYSRIDLELSEVCQEEQHIVLCAHRRIRSARNALSGAARLERARDYLLENPDHATETADVLPELMRMSAAEISERRHNMSRGAAEEAWVVLFYVQIHYADRVKEARFFLTEFAKRQFACEQDLITDTSVCDDTGDMQYMVEQIGELESLLAQRQIEFSAMVEYYTDTSFELQSLLN